MKFYLNTFRFPTVKVNITNENDNENASYDTLMKTWWNFYKNKKRFHFFFDFTKMNSFVSLKLIPNFIKQQIQMKKLEKQYLDYSIVVINNSILINILHYILQIITPIGILYISNDLKVSNELLRYLNSPFTSSAFLESYIVINNITKI